MHPLHCGQERTAGSQPGRRIDLTAEPQGPLLLALCFRPAQLLHDQTAPSDTPISRGHHPRQAGTGPGVVGLDRPGSCRARVQAESLNQLHQAFRRPGGVPATCIQPAAMFPSDLVSQPLYAGLDSSPRALHLDHRIPTFRQPGGISRGGKAPGSFRPGRRRVPGSVPGLSGSVQRHAGFWLSSLSCPILAYRFLEMRPAVKGEGFKPIEGSKKVFR